STQSPTWTLPESRSATLIVRLTPTTSTVATSGRSPPTATTRPGIARHTSSHPLDLHVANDLGHLDRQRDCEPNAQREHDPLHHAVSFRRRVPASVPTSATAVSTAARTGSLSSATTSASAAIGVGSHATSRTRGGNPPSA